MVLVLIYRPTERTNSTTCILTQFVPGKTGFLFIIAGSCARMPLTCHRSLACNRGQSAAGLGLAAVNTFFVNKRSL